MIARELTQRATEPPPRESANLLGPVIPATDGNPQLPPSTPLPTRILTFCFTDIEGSTQLWEQPAQTMSATLARYDAMVPAAIHGNGGVVFKTVGDSAH